MRHVTIACVTLSVVGAFNQTGDIRIITFTMTNDPRQGKKLKSNNFDKTMIKILRIKENKCFQIIGTCTNC